MANFEVFLPILLRHEGGYVNDPLDAGGETNRGITMSTFQACSRKLLGIEPTSENLKALTAAQAGIIYRDKYWNKVHGDEFKLQELANMVCDFYVHAGFNATKLFQGVLFDMGADVAIDGHIGPSTMAALKTLSEREVYAAFKQERIRYYENLGGKHPKFVKGWLARANSFSDLEDV